MTSTVQNGNATPGTYTGLSITATEFYCAIATKASDYTSEASDYASCLSQVNDAQSKIKAPWEKYLIPDQMHHVPLDNNIPPPQSVTHDENCYGGEGSGPNG